MLRRLVLITLFLVGFTLPLETMTEGLTVGAFGYTPNKILTAMLLGLAICERLFSGYRMVSNPKTLWIAAFYVSLAIASIHAAVKGCPTIELLVPWTRYLSVLFFYFLLCLVVRTRGNLDVFMWGLVGGGVIAAASAFFVEPAMHGDIERRSGIGGNANQAAANLLMALPMAYVLLVKTRSWLQRVVLVGSAAALLAGAFATASRSAFLGMIAMAGVWWFRFRGVQNFRYAIVVLVFLIGAVIFAPTGYLTRIQSLGQLKGDAPVNPRTESIEGRAFTYLLAGRAFLSNPILGVGARQFRPWVREHHPEVGWSNVVHNAILEVAVDQGLIGVIPYLAILILTWRDFSRAQRAAKRWRGQTDSELTALYLRAVFIQIGFLMILVVVQFHPGAYWKGMWAMFALSTVVLGLVRRRIRELELSSGVAAEPAETLPWDVGPSPLPVRSSLR